MNDQPTPTPEPITPQTEPIVPPPEPVALAPETVTPQTEPIVSPSEPTTPPVAEPIASPAQPRPLNPAMAQPQMTQPANPNPETPEPTEEQKRKKSNIRVVIIILVAILLPLIGLAILMFGIALPNMKNAQADTARRTDYTEMLVLMINYQTQNNGQLPSAGSTINLADYGSRIAKDPSGTAYTIKVINCTSANSCPGSPKLSVGQVYIVRQAKCSNNGSLIADSSSGSFAVWGYQTSKTGAYCSSSN